MTTRLQTETINSQPNIIIVSEKTFLLTKLLKKKLKKNGGKVFFSSKIPRNLEKFNYCFFINQTFKRHQYSKKDKTELIFIIQNKQSLLKNKKKYFGENKVIEIVGDKIKEETISRILWFSFSKTRERYLRVCVGKETRSKQYQLPAKKVKIFFTKKIAQILIISSLLFFYLNFIAFLTLSAFFNYETITNLKKYQVDKAKQFNKKARYFSKITKKSYSFSRHGYLFFSIAIIPDNMVDINDKTSIFLESSIALLEDTGSVIKEVLNKNKTVTERTQLKIKINDIQKQISVAEKNLGIINKKIPSSFKNEFIKGQINKVYELTSSLKNILPSLGELLGENKPKKYLLLFANNMELRPGGGFIGSFGILEFKDLTLDRLQIYDVYDADGQLKAHVEPPNAIRKYLNQPHWFLRDSAFSVSFLENYAQAKYFLKKEMGLDNFSGSFLITTSAIKNLLTAFDDLYLPDFDEVVNSKNFYLKAQLYAEKGFFPGSIQKKSFLASLTRQILIGAENVSIGKLITQFGKSLNNKQIAIYIDNPRIQNFLDSLYWSGRLINVSCNYKINSCLNDFIFPYDANLGVNKANFFVNRSISLKIILDENGRVSHFLSIQLKNDSPSEVFPGGTYKDYFQVLLPLGSKITSVSQDGIKIDDYDETDDQLKLIGFFFELKPKKTTDIKVNYYLKDYLKKGKNIYQMVFQKQIGASNSDLILELDLGRNISLENQNFSPLVKGKQIFYNDNLSSDKIFFLELNKN